jgi:hypothetical protein
MPGIGNIGANVAEESTVRIVSMCDAEQSVGRQAAPVSLQALPSEQIPLTETAVLSPFRPDASAEAALWMAEVFAAVALFWDAY